MHYDPNLESLRQHPVPEWYNNAKLGIFIHWGLFSD
jgi:alpha-L-fucosidase